VRKIIAALLLLAAGCSPPRTSPAARVVVYVDRSSVAEWTVGAHKTCEYLVTETMVFCGQAMEFHWMIRGDYWAGVEAGDQYDVAFDHARSDYSTWDCQRTESFVCTFVSEPTEAQRAEAAVYERDGAALLAAEGANQDMVKLDAFAKKVASERPAWSYGP
jgi:hypothetical protein